MTSSAFVHTDDSSPALDKQNPWPGPAAFRERDATFFRGREAESEKLLRRIKRALLTVLYGRSGLGKSSLLQAGVFPLLRRDRYMPVYVRLRYEESAPPLLVQIVERLAAATGTAEPPIESPPMHDGDSLWEHLHRREAAYWSVDNRPVTPVFVFDQFEEAFTLGRRQRAETNAFFEFLADLAEGTVPAKLLERLDARTANAAEFTLDQHRYHVVLSLREDYLADLKTLRPLMPSLLENEMRLAPMSGGAGLLVTQAGGPEIVSTDVGKLIVQLVADADDETPVEDVVVDPAILSLFLRRLNDRRLAEREPTIAAEWVRGGREEILSTFYEDGVRDLGWAVRVFVEDRLLTRSGNRTSVAREDALDVPGVTAEAIDTMIARRLLSPDDRAGRARLELAHDVLAGVVRRSRDERQKNEEAARKLAQAQAKADKEREETERRRMQLELEARLAAEEVRRQQAEVEREQAEVRRREAEAELTARRHEEEVRRIEQEEKDIRSQREEQHRLKAQATRIRTLWWARFLLTVTVSIVAVSWFAVRAANQAARALRQAELAEKRLEALRQMVDADSTVRDSILALHGISARRLSVQDSLRAEAVQAARAASRDTTTGRAVLARARDSLGLKLWATGATLRVRFLDGSPDARAKVQRYAAEWTPFANLHFTFCESCDAEIRIGFDPNGGSWSYLGTDALGIPAGQPTMNFGWLTSTTTEQDARQVVLHEFGHVFGLVEEHMNPNARIPWDTTSVYRYYARMQGWSADDVRQQLFARATGITSYRPFDPQSIMMFPIGPALTRSRLTVGVNSVLSAGDKAFVAKLYPKSRTGSTPPDSVPVGIATPTDSGAIGAPVSKKEATGMFGSKILDVAIGLALIFMMLSLIASAVREGVEAIVKSRAVELERGIRQLLDDPAGTGMARSLYEHPLVYSLYPGGYVPALKRFRGRMLPEYIPARSFAVALLDMATRGTNVGPYAVQQTNPVLTIPALRASVQRVPSTFVQRVLLSAIDSAQGDMRRVQSNIEAWYDSAMDRVSGHYKRRTQLWLFVIGLGTTLALNVNTITIADYLAHDEVARAALVRRAIELRQDTLYRQLVADSATIDRAAARAVYADLQSLKMPIGWERQLPTPPNATTGDVFWFRVKQVLGLLLTAFAIMLGAPFWFDLLNKFMVIRSTVKPTEKSPDEGSEDRQKGKKKDDAAADAEKVSMLAAATQRVASESSAARVDESRLTSIEVEAPYTNHEWAEGDPKEGII